MTAGSLAHVWCDAESFQPVAYGGPNSDGRYHIRLTPGPRAVASAHATPDEVVVMAERLLDLAVELRNQPQGEPQ